MMKLLIFESYINKISKDAFFVGELEIMLSSKIFNINIIVLKFNGKYKGYIQQCKFVSNNLISPIMFLEQMGGYMNGHYNLIHIKQRINAIDYIVDIP